MSAKKVTAEQILKAMDGFWKYVNDYSDPILDHKPTEEFNRVRRALRKQIKDKHKYKGFAIETSICGSIFVRGTEEYPTLPLAMFKARTWADKNARDGGAARVVSIATGRIVWD